jgi:mono/diheme cytochrome c family protein
MKRFTSCACGSRKRRPSEPAVKACKLHSSFRLAPIAYLRAVTLALGIASTPASAQAGEPPGQALFQKRCASCHGVDAKGNGPVAQVLKVPTPDLTSISKRNSGTFPSARVVKIITFGGDMAAHGTRLMPVWGTIFSYERGGQRKGSLYSRRAVVELKRYLETIQEK